MSTSFHWADYFLCSLSLLLSIGVGVFYGIRDRNKKSERAIEYMVAGRKLNILPVSISLFVSWLSAISFIGDPVEVYYHGAVYIFLSVGYFLPLPLIAHVFASKMNKAEVISAYEILDRRYGLLIRLIASACNNICAVLYLGIVIYAPAVSLSQVTGLQEWISMVVVGSIGTFYTTIGGMKAVVWADTFQSFIMLAGVLLVIIQGVLNIGGLHIIFERAGKGGRLNFSQNSWSPFVRSSVWTYIVGGFFRVLVPYVSMQSLVQRYLSLPSPAATKKAVYLNIPMYIMLGILFTLLGLTMYAYYDGCDPLQNGQISHPDQLVPFFMMDMLSFLPGLPGVFLASLFAASLSTISSVVNSCATNIVKDFIEPFYIKRHGHELYDAPTTKIVKLMTLVIGLIVTMLAYSILYIKVNVFPLTAKITGIISGRIGAMFICAICFKYTKAWSILVSSLVTLFITLWLGIGSFIYKPPQNILDLSVSKCHSSNRSLMNIVYTDYNNVTVTSSVNANVTLDSDLEQKFNIYHLSFLLYSPFGCIITLLLSVILAYLEKCWKRNDLKSDIEVRNQFGLVKTDENTTI